MIEQTDRLRPTPLVAFRKVSNTILIVNPRDNRLVTLNETGTAVWERLDGRTVQDIVGDLLGVFEVEPGVLLEDVTAFLEAMLARDLVRRCEQ